MNDEHTNQSFSVEDIRKLRIETDNRYKSMTREEIWQDIQNRAEEANRIRAEIRERNKNEE